MIEGTLLYFDPFVFKNGADPKPKYLLFWQIPITV